MKPIAEQAYFYCAKAVYEMSCFTMEPEMEAKLQAVIELCEEGDPEMCAFLGKEFYFGMNIPQDLDRALRYLTTAASAGDAMSQFLVGFMHWSGRGTQPDQDRALEWFLLASEQGIAEAMYNVAKILLIKDPKVNQEEALSWLERSSNAGYDAATDMLGDVREWIAEGANDEPPI